MKKVFALVVLAGSLSFFACENNNTTDGDAHDTDSTVNVDVNTNTTTVDSTVTVDTTAAPADTTKH